ncbi:MAG: hypothetical protein ABH950_07440 [Candidatus Altiarchaeota archaeon]
MSDLTTLVFLFGGLLLFLTSFLTGFATITYDYNILGQLHSYLKENRKELLEYVTQGRSPYIWGFSLMRLQIWGLLSDPRDDDEIKKYKGKHRRNYLVIGLAFLICFIILDRLAYL